MTRNEVAEVIHQMIQTIVQESGGQWKQSYRREVERIFEVMGKLSPDPDSGNIRKVVPNYNSHLVKKVGRTPIRSTPEQRAKAREILRQMGLI
jgi:hypothetical protein